jgi:rare lipoprotein A
MMRAFLAAMIFCLSATPSRADLASCYGREHHQWRTATGALYDPSRLTAAHRSWPFGTRVRVTNLHNGRSVTVLINDRGPAVWTHRAIDLSLGACHAIGSRGLARVFLQNIGDHHEEHSRLRPRHHVHRRRD